MDEPLGNAIMYETQNRTAPATYNADGHINVYIWDMDETLILLKSLLDGTFGAAFGGSKDTQKGIEIGKRWENHILQVCDEMFFYEQIENYNEPFLDAVSDYDDGRDLSDYDFCNDGFSVPYDDANKRKLAYRHRIIAQKYAQGLQNVLDEAMIKLWNDLYELTDSYTDGWLSSARALLDQIANGRKWLEDHVELDDTTDCAVAKCQNINALVTSGSLIPSLVKCLLFRYGDLISQENVYSSWEVGKLQCFRWIKERFAGEKVRFCVIGDGLEECRAAETMQWPFMQVDFRPGGVHRFPGLTLRTVGYYMDVIYGSSYAEDGDEN
uniref:protein-tyrosine-phosphatase n=1 Tax=Anthurium amnicola TaxID=1678845 RepID=A0A1D1XCV1_9ARAE